MVDRRRKMEVTENKTHSPVCRVCFPPDNTPTGRVPVGVRPFSVNTFSLSSLNTHTAHTLYISAAHTHTHT